MHYKEGEGERMVEVTKINGVKVLVNPDLIELVENAGHGYFLYHGAQNNCKRK